MEREKSPSVEYVELALGKFEELEVIDSRIRVLRLARESLLGEIVELSQEREKLSDDALALARASKAERSLDNRGEL